MDKNICKHRKVKRMSVKPIQFLKEVRNEGRRVSWPNMTDTRRLTLVVFIFVVAISLFLTFADMIFSNIIRWIIGY